MESEFCNMDTNNTEGKIYKIEILYNKFKNSCFIIILVNIIFKLILVLLKKEPLIKFLFLMLLYLISYKIIDKTITDKKNKVHFLSQYIMLNVDNLEYETTCLGLEGALNLYEKSHKNIQDILKTFKVSEFPKSIGIMLSCLMPVLTALYIFANIKNIDGFKNYDIMFFTILLIYYNLGIIYLREKISSLANSVANVEEVCYSCNLKIFNSKLAILKEKKDNNSFNCYSEMLYFLLDLYNYSSNFMNIKSLINKYFSSINDYINKLEEDNDKKEIKEEFIKLKEFTNKDIEEIEEGIETYIGILYKKISEKYRDKNLLLGEHNITKEQIQSLTLLI